MKKAELTIKKTLAREAKAKAALVEMEIPNSEKTIELVDRRLNEKLAQLKIDLNGKGRSLPPKKKKAVKQKPKQKGKISMARRSRDQKELRKDSSGGKRKSSREARPRSSSLRRKTSINQSRN